jgi:nucleotidyltransferase substrate binding protein (TIGR01987 family)
MPLDLSSLHSSCSALDRALGVVNDAEQWQSLSPQAKEAVSAGVIQTFEVAYEQSWKMLKRWIELNVSVTDVDGVTRRHLFRHAVESGLIDDVDLWMTFHQARNETSHSYNCAKATAVVEMAPHFLAACKALIRTLETQGD